MSSLAARSGSCSFAEEGTRHAWIVGDTAQLLAGAAAWCLVEINSVFSVPRTVWSSFPEALLGSRIGPEILAARLKSFHWMTAGR